MQCLPSGSPTAELFAASYNNRSNKSNTITLGLGTEGYTQNTSDGWLKPEDNHGIYNKDGSSSWWLASPNCVHCMDYGDGQLIDWRYDGRFNYVPVDDCSVAVRPLVCIPTSVFNSKYATSTTLVDE